LHYAATRESEEVVRMLLSAGADKNGVNRDGFTPLALALTAGTDAAMLLAGERACPRPRLPLTLSKHYIALLVSN
jgi:ankyrin repeat protein